MLQVSGSHDLQQCSHWPWHSCSVLLHELEQMMLPQTLFQEPPLPPALVQVQQHSLLSRQVLPALVQQQVP